MLKLPKRRISLKVAQREYDILLNIIQIRDWRELGKFLDNFEIRN